MAFQNLTQYLMAVNAFIYVDMMGSKKEIAARFRAASPDLEVVFRELQECMASVRAFSTMQPALTAMKGKVGLIKNGQVVQLDSKQP